MKPLIADALERTQSFLESCYQVKIFERATQFCSTQHSIAELGTVLCKNDHSDDLEISLLLDRDYFSASLLSLNVDHYSIIFEEVSHFFLLGIHHSRGRRVTQLELEAQSEIDRLLCCLSLESDQSLEVATHLRNKLFYESYPNPRNERARTLATSFLSRLSSTKPHAWRASDFAKLSEFFNSDLPQKFSIARCF